MRYFHVTPLAPHYFDLSSYHFLRLHFVFSREISVAPQLWGNCTTVVGQLHHNCGAVAPQLWGNENEAEKNNYLAGGNNYLGFPSGRLLGEVLIENRGTGCNFAA